MERQGRDQFRGWSGRQQEVELREGFMRWPGRGQGRGGSILWVPQVLLGSWYCSQEGQWETELRYLHLLSSSKNIFKFYPHRDWEDYRKVCGTVSCIHMHKECLGEKQGELPARGLSWLPPLPPKSTERAWAFRGGQDVARPEYLSVTGQHKRPRPIPLGNKIFEDTFLGSLWELQDAEVGIFLIDPRASFDCTPLPFQKGRLARAKRP